MAATTILIIGAGIAGTSLAYALLKHGADVRVVDTPLLSGSSRVAAGVINPITGKRFSLLWQHEALLQTARQLYNELEDEYTIPFLRPIPVLRLFASAEESLWWLERRSNDAARSPYMRLARSEEIPKTVHADHGGLWIYQAVQVDTAAVVESLRCSLKRSGRLHEEQMDYKRLHLGNSGVRYTLHSGEDLHAEYVVFAEGWRVLQNPWLRGLPLVPAQGDILTIRPHEPLERIMINKGVFIVPLVSNQDTNTNPETTSLWKLGATYQWDAIEELGDTPRDTGKHTLIRSAHKLLRGGFDVVRHEAGVRPASVDYKPIVGIHPLHPRGVVVNGFGSKGSAYAPFVANHLVAMLEHAAALPPEIDIVRFAERFTNKC